MTGSRRCDEMDGAVCPLIPPLVLARRIKNKKHAFTALGLEKYCAGCREFWPHDTEFFYSVPSKPDGLNDWCKACYREWREKRNAQLQALPMPMPMPASAVGHITT